MRIPSALLQLARLFIGHSPLYLVGGAVRDGLIGIESSDLDVASSLSTEEVKAIIKDSAYKICGEFPRTGTLVIMGKGIKCEYTTFRADSYPTGKGSHAPSQVEFTNDINVDAFRRDFTCNAVYYDIVGASYVDPTGGISDIQDRIITTTRHPKEVLSEDALRILRLPRIATEVGFHVEPDTMRMAIEFAPLLSDIAPERIQAELTKILTATSKYPDFCGFKPSYGISLLNELGVSAMIFGDNIPFATLISLDNLKDWGYYKATLASYLAMLYIDKDISHLQEFLVNYKFSKEITKETMSMLEGFNIARSLISMGNDYTAIKFFCLKFYPQLPQIIGLLLSREINCDKIMEGAHIVSNIGLPITLADLSVGGRDIIARGITGVAIGEILQQLYNDCIELELTSKDEQLAQLEKILKARGQL